MRYQPRPRISVQDFTQYLGFQVMFGSSAEIPLLGRRPMDFFRSGKSHFWCFSAKLAIPASAIFDEAGSQLKVGNILRSELNPSREYLAYLGLKLLVRIISVDPWG